MANRNAAMEASPGADTGVRPGWLPAIYGLGAGLAALIALYFETYASMVAVWERSETFAHGFLILPISLWLAAGKREQLEQAAPETDFRALPLIALLGLAWLAARASGMLVAEQVAAVAMIPAVTWVMLGWPIVRILRFPLAFLFLAIPAGEGLVAPLMGFTADLTVALIRLTGIPVFQDGTIFSLPSADWAVIESCSGLRYLLASFTLGLVYAYLNFRSPYRRLAFIVLSMGLPLIANGLRAFIIVLIGHFTEMRWAAGFDHLAYGWVFFGFTMLLMFSLGYLWRERGLPAEELQRIPRAPARTPSRHYPRAVAWSLMLLAIWPGGAVWIGQGQPIYDLSGAKTRSNPHPWRSSVAGSALDFRSGGRR